jgi:hypothetical protein
MESGGADSFNQPHSRYHMAFSDMTFFDKLSYLWSMPKDGPGPGLLLALCVGLIIYFVVWATTEK